MTINNSYELFGKIGHHDNEPPFEQPVIVADRILSPMNVGAILRLAGNIHAAKVWFVYDEDPGFRSYKIKRTSSGASEKVSHLKSSKKCYLLITKSLRWKPPKMPRVFLMKDYRKK